MKTIQSDVLIIGGGLTGLTIAYLLKDKGIEINVVEARDRLGGRIYTSYMDDNAPVEAGATWLGRKHTYLMELLTELQLGIHEQQMGDRAIYEPISTSPHQIVLLPPNTDPSYRIKGGSSILIDGLAEFLDPNQIYLKQQVKSIEEIEDGLLVKSDDYEYRTNLVISTLPPALFYSTIDIHPGLPDSFNLVAKQTHTWMGESIKIGLRYKYPFWRKQDSSGTIVSNVGPIPEMYDHSDFKDSSYALKGFLNGSYYSITKEERLEMILTQLRKYYGREVDELIDYEELVWRKEEFTFVEYESHVLPHQNNGHPAYRESYLDGRLFIAGSETASDYPGYMEGAVRSAKFICKQIESYKTKKDISS